MQTFKAYPSNIYKDLVNVFRVVGGQHILQCIFLCMKSKHFEKRNTLSNSFIYISFPVILGGHPLDITRENSEGSFVKPVGLGLLVTTLVDSSV
jgi:hypothetical protein